MSEPNESTADERPSAAPSQSSPSEVADTVSEIEAESEFEVGADAPAVERAVRALEDDLAALERALSSAEVPAAERRVLFESVAGRVQEVLAETGDGHRPIDTYSGETITPFDPDPDAIVLEDVAHALANLSRFAGQGDRFYSVARHAVHVSLEVEARGGSLAAQRWGLLHDASEAYFADVPAPVKRSLPGYTRAEKRFQAAVRTAFGIESPLSSEGEQLVDAVDSAVGRYELAVHFPDGEFEVPALEYDPERLERDADAATLFRERARALGLVDR